MPNQKAFSTKYAPTVEARRSGIYFPSMAALREGLEVLLGKRPAGTQNAYAEECKNATPDFDLGLVMMEVTRSTGAASNFLDSLFADIERTLATYHVFTTSYEYEGVGPFYKSSLWVWKAGDEGFIYSMCAANTLSEQIEGPLAQSLCTERCIASVVVMIRGESVGTSFRFDLGDICARVNEALSLTLDPDAVVAELMTEADADYAPPKMTLASLDEGLELRCRMRDTGYTHLKDDNRTLAYHADGTVITGPLGKDYSEQEPNGFAIPLIDLEIRMAGDPYSTWILDPVARSLAREIAGQLQLAFSEP